MSVLPNDQILPVLALGIIVLILIALGGAIRVRMPTLFTARGWSSVWKVQAIITLTLLLLLLEANLEPTEMFIYGRF